MRIISGKKRGANLVPPAGATRPTADRTREAIFGLLAGGRFDERFGEPLAASLVIDAFAGSGAMGLEAWSRGAKRIILIDHDKSAIEAIRRNISRLAAEEACEVLRRDLSRHLNRRDWRNAKAELVFLDPPWRKSSTEPDSGAIALERLTASGALAEGALIVIQHDARIEPRIIPSTTILDQRRHGRAGITLARYIP